MNILQSKQIKQIGVIGGGQLAWMMADAAKKLGIQLIIQTPQLTDPAVSVATGTIQAAIDDAKATSELAKQSDVITFENEFVNLDALMALAENGVCFRPGLPVLAPLLDKYHQRCYLQNLGLPVPKFITWEKNNHLSSNQLELQQPLGYPLVIKARRHGYDGQGTVIIKQPQELETTWKKWNYSPVLLEEFIPFERELAVIAARSTSGELAIYPIVETQQENQVCRRVIAPAALSEKLLSEIEEIARIFLESLQAVGIFALELFLTKNGKILVNEVAPRTHNSGHFTIDACEVSQFEQHLRAVSNLPLGNPSLKCAGAVMVNLLGYENSQDSYQQKRKKLAEIAGANVHWYGKTQSRPGRKLGHVTVLIDAPASQLQSQAETIAKQCEAIWYGEKDIFPDIFSEKSQ